MVAIIRTNSNMDHINFEEDLHYPELHNAQELSKANPETFEVDSVEYFRENVKYTDFVKICNGAERFWVVIKAFVNDDEKGNNFMIGEINNRLHNENYDMGDLIMFEYKNIYDLMKNEGRWFV